MSEVYDELGLGQTRIKVPKVSEILQRTDVESEPEKVHRRTNSLQKTVRLSQDHIPNTDRSKPDTERRENCKSSINSPCASTFAHDYRTADIAKQKKFLRKNSHVQKNLKRSSSRILAKNKSPRLKKMKSDTTLKLKNNVIDPAYKLGKN